MHRPVHLFLALFAIAWFAVVMPAHQRGQIRLPGMPESQAAAGCCAVKSGGHCGDDQPGEESDDPVRSCAVCHLVAKLSPPVVMIIPLPAAEPVAQLIVSTPADPDSAADLRPQRSRAPPLRI